MVGRALGHHDRWHGAATASPRSGAGAYCVSQAEMDSERLVQLGGERSGQDTDECADAFDRDRAQLLGLRLRIAIETGGRGRQQDLERVDATDVRRHRHDRDDASAEPLGGGIRGVVADDDRRSSLVRFGTPSGTELDNADLTAPHSGQPVGVGRRPQCGVAVALALGPGVFVRRTQSSGTQEPNCSLEYRGARGDAVIGRVLIEELDVVLGKRHTDLHTAILLAVPPR